MKRVAPQTQKKRVAWRGPLGQLWPMVKGPTGPWRKHREETEAINHLPFFPLQFPNRVSCCWRPIRSQRAREPVDEIHKKTSLQGHKRIEKGGEEIWRGRWDIASRTSALLCTPGRWPMWTASSALPYSCPSGGVQPMKLEVRRKEKSKFTLPFSAQFRQ